MRASRLVARVLLAGAAASILVALCLFSAAAYVLTWPYRRNPSHAAQVRAGMNAALALAALLGALRHARSSSPADSA